VRVASHDPDDLLLAAMSAPPPLEDARGSLAFWQRRRSALPFYRRDDRREADEMIRRWRDRVAAAERRRYGTGVVGLLRRAFAGELRAFLVPTATALVWRLLPRRLLLGVAAGLALWLLAGVLTLAAIVALLA